MPNHAEIRSGNKQQRETQQVSVDDLTLLGRCLFSVSEPEKENACQRNHRTEEFARKFHSRIFGRHTDLRYREFLFPDNVLDETRPSHERFDDAGDDGKNQDPLGNRPEDGENQENGDKQIKS